MIEPFIRHYVDGYRNYKNGRWCYEDGCFYKGLADLHAAGDGDWLLERLVEHVNRRVQPSGVIDGYRMEEFSLDNINAGKVLFALRDKTGDPRYAKALRTLREQLRRHPRTKAENFWHKKAYPWQVWLDGLYMALPLLAQYSVDYEQGASLADVRRQIETVRRLMHDPKTGLYYHGYDESRESAWADPETGLSPCLWSRAIGWYAMALVDLVDVLPEGHADRPYYAELLGELAEALLPWRQRDGLWMQVMDQPERAGNYPESSCTAMFAYAFMKGHRLGVLDARIADIGHGSFDGLVARCLRARANGVAMGGICLMAGLGDINGEFGYRNGSYEYYVGEPVVANDPKGVGPLMMAQAELRLQD